MIRQSTVDLLREMRFSGMAAELERQISDSESFRELSFEDRLANTDANEPFARRIQTSKTVYLNQGNGRLNQAKQRQAIQYNWIKPH